MTDKEKLFDVRVVDRYLQEGKIKEKEYKNFIDNLPDLSSEAEKLEIDLEEESPEESQDQK